MLVLCLWLLASISSPDPPHTKCWLCVCDCWRPSVHLILHTHQVLALCLWLLVSMSSPDPPHTPSAGFVSVIAGVHEFTWSSTHTKCWLCVCDCWCPWVHLILHTHQVLALCLWLLVSMCPPDLPHTLSAGFVSVTAGVHVSTWSSTHTKCCLCVCDCWCPCPSGWHQNHEGIVQKVWLQPKLPTPKWLVNWLQAILGSQWCLMLSASSVRQQTSLCGVTRLHTSQRWSCVTVPFTQHPSKDKPAAVGSVNNPLAHPARSAFSVTRVCAPVVPDVFSTICVLHAAT